MQKNITGPVITVIVVLVLIVGVVALVTGKFSYFASSPEATSTTPIAQVTPTPPVSTSTVSTSTTPVEPAPAPVDESKTVIGMSAGGNAITAYHYGDGQKELLFIGGIHGGYSWNTALVAYEMMDYLEANGNAIPDNVKVTVIPVLNPDGLKAVTGSTGRFAASAVPKDQKATVKGRFNANNVDLNRNFDCEWKSNGVWQDTPVSGGGAAFSEPEAKAIKTYVEGNDIAGAVVWYSAAGGVYTSNCRTGVLSQTKELTELYAKASGYSENAEFDFYEITGDMVNWFARENIPAISVLLSTHSDPEWSSNKAGVAAVLKYYAE